MSFTTPGVADMLLDCVKALAADYMLYPAGILSGDMAGNSEGGQPAGQKLVTLIDHLSNLTAGCGQGDKTGVVHSDMGFFAQIFHGYADAGFLEAQLVCDVDRADYGKSFAQDQDSFEIVFC